jgi:hypothetical protein
MMFEGVVTGSGPTLFCQTNGSVALGVYGLRQFQPQALGSRHPPPPGWWVVKYCQIASNSDPLFRVQY